MKTDGSEQVQVTTDDYNNWFPHPSPDGKLLVFLTYDRDVKGHPEDKDVTLRLLTLATGQINSRQTLRRPGHHQRPLVVAGQPKLAFVSYQLVDHGRRGSRSPTPELFTAINAS